MNALPSPSKGVSAWPRQGVGVIQANLPGGVRALQRHLPARQYKTSCNVQAFQVSLQPKSGGSPLPEDVRHKMESAFGADFSSVRVHVGHDVSSIGAIAYTWGTNVHFAPGHYNPHSVQGQRLLGHELWHVVQQKAGRVRNPFGVGIAVVQDAALEAEADRMGATVAATAAQPTPREAVKGHSVRSHVVQRMYVEPVGYSALTGQSQPHYYGQSQMQPDTQTTFATGKLNGFYLKKSMSDTEHAEEDIVAQVKNLCDLSHTCLVTRGQLNKLSIHLNKSPCTSISRGGKPATRTNGLGCTERLIDLKKNGYRGHKFFIRLKIQNLYQPQITGAKAASILAIEAMVAAGIPIIGYDREAKLERAKTGALSSRGEPLSPKNVADDDYEYSSSAKTKLATQWQSISTAAGKPGVSRWRNY